MQPTQIIALVAAAVVVGLAALIASGGGSSDHAPSTPSTSAVTREAPAPAPTPEEPATTESPRTPTVEQPAPVVGPYQRGGYAGIVGQLRARLGFEPRVLEVILGPQLAEFTVLDPARRGRVVSLEWNGGELTGPTVVAGADYPSPTDIHGRPVPLQSAAFPLRALRERVILGALHRLRRARVRSPTPSTMVIERFLPFDRRVLILFNVSAAGGGGRQLRFTLDGKLVQVV